MKVVDRIIELPKISIRDLEQRVRSTHSPLAMPSSGQLASQSQYQIVKEIKVVSPFYHRVDHHTEKCECQYHRLKRYKQGLRRLRLQHQGRHYNIRDSGQDSERELKPILKETDTFRLGGIKGSRSEAKLLEPLGRRSWNRLDKGQIIQQKKIVEGEENSPNENSLKQLKPSREERYKTEWKVSDVNSKLTVMNPDYVSLISRRLQINRYKEKYLKMLFGFIKMKTNQDRLYLYNSKAYLKNSLNILLNHFSMEKLTSLEELTEQSIKKIAYHMACKHERVPEILEDLKKAIEEMENYLNNVRKTQEEKYKLKELAQFEELSAQERNNQRPSADICEGKDYSHVEEYQVFLNNRRSFDHLLGNDHEEGFERGISDWQDTNEEGHLQANKFFPMRKSHRHQDSKDFDFIKNSEFIVCNTQNSEMSSIDPNEREIQAKTYFRGSRTLLHPLKSRSPRATVNSGCYESGTEQAGSPKLSRKKSKKNTKIRKAQVTKRIDVLEFDPKYKDINYRQFCTKQEFMHLISEVERLDRNDDERAVSVFNKLKAERFLDNPDKLNYLLQHFSPLLNKNCQEKFLKHVVAIRDKRYMEKLLRELDQTLTEVKRTDPRNLDTEELFPYSKDRTLQQPHHHLRIAQYKGHHVVQRASIGGKIIYYEADQKVERHITQEQNEKMQLEQGNLSEIQAENIDPKLTTVVDHRVRPKEKNVLCKLGLGRNEQKKILQFMHQNHPNTFNYLNQSITDLCEALTGEAAQSTAY